MLLAENTAFPLSTAAISSAHGWVPIQQNPAALATYEVAVSVLTGSCCTFPVRYYRRSSHSNSHSFCSRCNPSENGRTP
ncbi:hypothetical protein N658DRAFT_500424 [Parathielavia hyrcaniae]|uniref:Uncharacterized protein n=1 Tax=Parathielavia hyrcaniae TaxID=113614 RepID=A0AAN6PT30_9PEZI|nr:hypothetical protein N658DRAFT_500424 [Parathielavia hyrcaniae]